MTVGDVRAVVTSYQPLRDVYYVDEYKHIRGARAELAISPVMGLHTRLQHTVLGEAERGDLAGFTSADNTFLCVPRKGRTDERVL
jgi:hypothetical protein